MKNNDDFNVDEFLIGMLDGVIVIICLAISFKMFMVLFGD